MDNKEIHITVVRGAKENYSPLSSSPGFDNPLENCYELKKIGITFLVLAVNPEFDTHRH